VRALQSKKVIQMAKFTPKPSNHTVPPLAYTTLPKVNVIPPAKDPNSYPRPGSAPAIPANTGPAVRAPQVR
jgi:hypothetical protein